MVIRCSQSVENQLLLMDPFIREHASEAAITDLFNPKSGTFKKLAKAPRGEEVHVSRYIKPSPSNFRRPGGVAGIVRNLDNQRSARSKARTALLDGLYGIKSVFHHMRHNHQIEGASDFVWDALCGPRDDRDTQILRLPSGLVGGLDANATDSTIQQLLEEAPISASDIADRGLVGEWDDG
jgi:hypothetical protein